MSFNALAMKMGNFGQVNQDFQKAYDLKASLPSQMPFIQPNKPSLDKTTLVKKSVVLYSGAPGVSGPSTSDFNIVLAKPLEGVVGVQLRSISSPNGIYNITALNNTFAFDWVWTNANSTTDWVTGTKPANNSGMVYVSIPNGSYSLRDLVKAMTDGMNSWIEGVLGNWAGYYFGDDTWAWIVGDVGSNNKAEFYSQDLGLNFALSYGGLTGSIATYGFSGTGQVNAVNSGGIYGTTDYFYLIMPSAMDLTDYSVICLVSEALGNDTLSSQGSPFVCHMLIPVGEPGKAINVRWDSTLWEQVQDKNRRAFNKIQNIDIKLTDLNGNILNLNSNDVLLNFDVLQELKPDSLGV